MFGWSYWTILRVELVKLKVKGLPLFVYWSKDPQQVYQACSSFIYLKAIAYLRLYKCNHLVFSHLNFQRVIKFTGYTLADKTPGHGHGVA